MECPHIPIIPYHKFSERIHNKAVSERIPLGGVIEPTLRCNLKCAHCYVAYDPMAKEMTYEEICHILDEITEAGCLWLLLTGGEPLVRDDFIDIYTYAKKKGLIITLFTNGTLITPQIADYLKEWPPFSVEITLYGITKETYEKVSGVPGSLQRCQKGINLLLERKIPLTLKTMVMTLNKHELWDIKKYVEDLGLEFTFDAILNPKLDGSRQPCRLRITPEEVVKLDLADKNRIKAYKELCENFWGPPGTDKLYACGGGLISFHIDPYTNLSLCILSRSPNYNIRKGSFQEGWYDFIPRVRAQKLKGEYRCAECELYSLCGQCPGWAQLENGDPESPVEYLCQIAYLRAETLGLKAKSQIKREEITVFNRR